MFIIKMQPISFPVVATAIVALATQALACVDFSLTVNEYSYATGNLKDNGQQICTVNSYGDNNGWGMSCNSGYSAYINDPSYVVNYNTPHGDYSFATNCQDDYDGSGDTVCTASPFC